MAIHITIGQQTFTAAQYKHMSDQKPHMLLDMRALASLTKRTYLATRISAKGRKAAAYRSMSLNRARLLLTPIPNMQSLYSMKHMDISPEERKVLMDKKVAEVQAHEDMIERTARQIRFLG